METLRVDFPFDKNDFIREHIMRWKIHNRKNTSHLMCWERFPTFGKNSPMMKNIHTLLIIGF
jgi:hypothetical protein